MCLKIDKCAIFCVDMVLIGRNPYKSLFAQPDSNDRKMAEADIRAC